MTLPDLVGAVLGRRSLRCFRVALALPAVFMVAGCRRSEAPREILEPTEGELPQAPPPTPVLRRCSRVAETSRFALGSAQALQGVTPSAEPASPDERDAGLQGEGHEEGEPAPVPSAIELGNAVAFPRGFAVGYLRHTGGEAHAMLTLVGHDVRSPVSVDLGRTHGEVEAPRSAAAGDHIAVVLADDQASKPTLRLALVRTNEGPPTVTWAPPLAQGRGGSSMFDVELGARRGLVAWDEFDKTLRHGVIQAVSFGAQNLSDLTKPRVISPKSDDVEYPRVLARSGGFWLAWLVYPKAAADPTKPGVPGAPARPADREEGPLLELGPRSLMLAPLDENGSIAGPAVSLTPPGARVVVYDAAAQSDGSVLLAWREEEGTKVGLEGPIVSTARVKSDGSIERATLDAERAGRGIPGLFVDAAAPPGAHAAWLALAGMDDQTGFGALDARGALVDTFGADPELGSAEPLRLHAGRLLVAEPKGPDVELQVLSCAPGPSPR